jgi:hypothetical protein
MAKRAKTDRSHFRLVITRRGASEVLLAMGPRRSSLPRLTILSGFRLADQLVAGVLEKYRLRTCCLLTEIVQPPPHPAIPNPYAVMEALSPFGCTPPGTSWFPFETARLDASCDLTDRQLIAHSFERFTEKAKGPFERPGWTEELFAWVREQIAPLGLRLTGDFRQMGSSPSSNLTRIETTGRAVWFKAAGEPNAHELPLTLSLAQLFPMYVPGVIAVHSGLNGWLSPEIPGASLAGSADYSAWDRAAEALAELQIRSIGKTAQLLRAGARDLRMGRLVECINAFLSRMRELMAMQEKRSPAPLAESELRRLAEALERSCTLLEEFGLPHTLGHLDFNPGNIFVNGDQCVFLDWAEGSVGNPLLTLEYLVEHMCRSGLTESGSPERLISRYLRPWACFYSPQELRQARKLSPLVAVFAYATANDSWRSPNAFNNSPKAGYFRALTRRMYREATRTGPRSESCATT